MRVCARFATLGARHWPMLVLLLASFAPARLSAAPVPARVALPAGAGYAASASWRALVSLGQPVSGGAAPAGEAGVWAGLLVGTSFGAPGAAALT